MEFKNFIFQAWKVMEFYGRSRKIMKIIIIIITGRLIIAAVKARIKLNKDEFLSN